MRDFIQALPSPIAYVSNDRLVSPYGVDSMQQVADKNFQELDHRTLTLEGAVMSMQAEHIKLRTFMTWLAEQRPDVLDEFSNTVDVAKKLDGMKEPA